MKTQKRYGAIWGLVWWLTNWYRIARLHNWLTCNGVKVHAIRPVADGSFSAIVNMGNQADATHLSATQVNADVSSVEVMSHISLTESVLKIDLAA